MIFLEMNGVDMTTHMDRAIRRVLEDSLKGANTRMILGGDHAVAAVAALEITGQDGNPEVVQLEWPVLVGPTGQFVFAPIDMTDTWVNAISECHVFKRTIDVQAVRNATMDEVTSAVTLFDPSNVLTSLVSLMPLATRLQRGIIVDVAVTNLTFNDAVSAEIQKYLTDRYMRSVTSVLPVLSQASLTDPSFLNKVAPLISKFSGKNESSTVQAAGGLQGLMGVLRK